MQITIIVIIIIYLLIWTANGFLPGGGGTTIKHNTQIHITYKITHHAKRKHGTQIIVK
jgi:hypothetical protein